ncbi:membrane-associated phosphatidylinositol transfer 3-like protein [Labeo rohita]|uniref:Membrane-associated phosphatidylinositol transfer 3-like protein n=1 Tax=Labeo rohita TaxID=84645 RepID=A0A498M9E5_LABRO|nr:membrane-associated phosphatidylinositol transfer 3-like protein [Labeo rohita]
MSSTQRLEFVLAPVAQLQPACSQIFNLFYPSDPSASRLEPLLHPVLTQLPPFPVPRYQRYPLGDGRSNLMAPAALSLLTRHAPSGIQLQPFIAVPPPRLPVALAEVGQFSALGRLTICWWLLLLF